MPCLLSGSRLRRIWATEHRRRHGAQDLRRRMSAPHLTGRHGNERLAPMSDFVTSLESHLEDLSGSE
jgi:hypothetical protein